MNEQGSSALFNQVRALMPVGLFQDTVRFLSGLEPMQLELQQIYKRRLTALTAVNPQVLLQLVAQEQSIQQRLRKHLQQRAVILGNARRQKLA